VLRLNRRGAGAASLAFLAVRFASDLFLRFGTDDES
jgi:hypothetical protein